MSSETESGPSFGKRALAIAILLIVGWILVKFIVGIIAGIFWLVLVILGVIAVIWAWRILF